MERYTSTVSLKQIAQRLLASERPLLTTHAKPDGDAFGSVVALARALQLAGGRPRVLLCPPVPMSFAQLRGANIPELYRPDESLSGHDLFVVVDTGAWAQVAPMDRPLREVLDKVVIIDHHLSGDIPASQRYIDGQAAACAQIIAQLIDEMAMITGKDLLDATVCEQLFVGIASDTGWFRFSNTRPATHELAARLLRLGVDQNHVYEKLEQTARPQKLALMQKALASLTFLADGRAAVMVLRQSDFRETGARPEETEGLIDLPRTVAGMEVVVVISQPPVPDGQDDQTSVASVRVSFRSKPGVHAVNVAQVAAAFGGGGHARAAGAKFDAPIDKVIRLVSDAVTQAVQPADESFKTPDSVRR